MNEETNESKTTAAVTGSSSARVFVLLGILAVIGVLAGLSLPARGDWKEAQQKAEAILGTDDDFNPAAFMKAIGKTPMVKEDQNGLTQVYRWSGGLRTYELKIKFDAPWSDQPWVYAPTEGVAATAKLRFSVDSLKNFTLANEVTGSTYAKLAALEVDNSSDPTMSPPSGPPDGSDSGPGQATGGKGGNRPGGGRQGGGFGRSSGPPEELNLTDDQKTKWTTASTKQREEMRELFSGGIPREEMGTKMAELREAFQEDLKAFLTEEQLAKYEEIRSQRPQGGRGGGGFGGGNRRGGNSGRSSGPPEELKLTDDQKTKWTAASNKQRDGMREIFTSGIPREDMGAKMTELREAFQADVRAFLTPEQQEKYKEIESQRPQRGSGGRGKRGGEGSGKRPSGPGKGGPGKGN